MSLALGAVKFKGAGRAAEVLDGYIELHPQEDWPRQAGIIERHKLGRIAIYQNLGDDWDDEDTGTAAGLGLGGLTGALIGAIAGPPGMAVGAALGGAMGGILGAADEDERPFFTVIRGKLEKDTSAILLLADDPIVDRMLKEFGPSGVEKLRRKVSDELRGNLEAAVRVVARQQEQPGAPAH
jgi:uncharacterized membrane protein